MDISIYTYIKLIGFSLKKSEAVFCTLISVLLCSLSCIIEAYKVVDSRFDVIHTKFCKMFK